MSKTSVHVIPLLRTSAGSPSPILGSSPISCPWHLWSSIIMPFQLISTIFPYSVCPQAPWTHEFSSSSITSAFVFACHTFLHLACHGQFYSVLQGSAHMWPPLWASFTRGINLHSHSILHIPLSRRILTLYWGGLSSLWSSWIPEGQHPHLAHLCFLSSVAHCLAQGGCSVTVRTKLCVLCFCKSSKRALREWQGSKPHFCTRPISGLWLKHGLLTHWHLTILVRGAMVAVLGTPLPK